MIRWENFLKFWWSKRTLLYIIIIKRHGMIIKIHVLCELRRRLCNIPSFMWSYNHLVCKFCLIWWKLKGLKTPLVRYFLLSTIIYSFFNSMMMRIKLTIFFFFWEAWSLTGANTINLYISWNCGDLGRYRDLKVN